MAKRSGAGAWTSAVVVAIALALAAASDAAAQFAAPPTRCPGPEALVAQGLLEEAKTSYTKLATANDAPPCAATGLKDVKRRLKAAAAAEPKPDPCTGARALARQGQLEEAKDVYAKLASGDDPPPCAARGLKRVKARIAGKRSLSERAGDRADTLFTSLGDLLELVLFFVLVIALVGVLVLRYEPLTNLARRRAWARSRPRLSDGKLKRFLRRPWRALMTPITWAVATTVKIEELKGSGDKEGPDMTRAIAGLLPVVPARRSTKLEVALAPFAGKSALSEVTEAISGAPHGKAVAAVLSIARRLVPRQQLHVTGSVLTSDARGPGLALEIATDAGDVIEAETLWSKDFDPHVPAGSAGDDAAADRTLRLATAGAVWVLFAVLRYRRVLTLDDWRRYLGTPVWRSYALVLIAVSNDSPTRDKLTTQAGYAQALDLDPANLPALFNLARIDVRRKEWDQAVRRLKDIRQALHEREGGERRLDRDPLRFQVAYSLAYACLSNTPQDDTRIPKVTEIVRVLRKALLDLERTLRDLDDPGSRPTQDHDDLYMQLQRFEGPMLTMWAYLKAELDPSEQASTTVPALERRELIRQLKKDELKHADLMRELVGEPTNVRPGTHYNLASYYTRIGELDKALSALEDSVEVGTLTASAAADPQLKALRSAKRTAFEKILDDHRPAPPSWLGRVDAIGRKNAEALSGLGIDSPEQLVARAHTAKQRAVLAHDLDVGRSLVEHWARLADLRGLGVAEPSRLNLLDVAGVGSRDLLASATPAALRKRLESIQPRPKGAQVPTLNQLKDWIERARKDGGNVEP